MKKEIRMSLNCDFKEQMNQKVHSVEEILQEYLPRQKGRQSIIMEAMCYSLMAGGKRLRPLLMSETFRLFPENPVRSIHLWLQLR